jgi:acetoin utilization deacetylase AcuC-like enzyme
VNEITSPTPILKLAGEGGTLTLWREMTSEGVRYWRTSREHYIDFSHAGLGRSAPTLVELLPGQWWRLMPTYISKDALDELRPLLWAEDRRFPDKAKRIRGEWLEALGRAPDREASQRAKGPVEDESGPRPLEQIPVFYRDEMVAAVESFSPSAGKPRAVVESWRQLSIPIVIISPTPVTHEDLYRAHSAAFVDGIFAGRTANGFGNRDVALALSLPFTSGAMLSAAREAMSNRQVAVAPCSGFHHAHHDAAHGFCTFNGLMVTALALKQAGEVKRVGILDFDQHYGDGTDDIIETLAIDWVVHYTAGREFHDPAQADDFLAVIPNVVASMRGCDVILYQAGADPHIQDPLGGWLTTRQLAERDYRVFATATTLGIPVAWNLAGGYQTPLRRVLEVHDNTMRACSAVYIGD